MRIKPWSGFRCGLRVFKTRFSRYTYDKLRYDGVFETVTYCSTVYTTVLPVPPLVLQQKNSFFNDLQLK